MSAEDSIKNPKAENVNYNELSNKIINLEIDILATLYTLALLNRKNNYIINPNDLFSKEKLIELFKMSIEYNTLSMSQILANKEKSITVNKSNNSRFLLFIGLLVTLIIFTWLYRNF